MKKLLTISIIFLLILNIILLTGCGKTEVPEDPFFLLPQNTAIYAHIQLDSIIATMDTEEIKNDPLSQKMLTEMKDRFEIDPLTDIESITIGIWTLEPPSGIAIIKGAFNETKIIETLKKENVNMKEETYKHFRIYSVIGDEPYTFTFLDWTHMLVSSDTAGIKRSIDTTFVPKKEQNNIYGNSTMNGMLQRTDFASQIYGGANFKAVKTQQDMGLSEAMIALKFSKNDFSANVNIGCADANRANGIKMGIDMAKGMLGTTPELSSIVQEKIQISISGNNVIISANLSKEDIENIKQSAAAMPVQGF